MASLFALVCVLLERARAQVKKKKMSAFERDTLMSKVSPNHNPPPPPPAAPNAHTHTCSLAALVAHLAGCCVWFGDVMAAYGHGRLWA